MIYTRGTAPKERKFPLAAAKQTWIHTQLIHFTIKI